MLFLVECWKSGDGWRELALRIEEKAVVEEWISTALPTSTVFLESWPVGQRVRFTRVSAYGFAPGCLAGNLVLCYNRLRRPLPWPYRRRQREHCVPYAHHQRLEGREIYAGFGLRSYGRRELFRPPARTGAFHNGIRHLTEFLSTNGGFARKDRVFQALHSAGDAGNL